MEIRELPKKEHAPVPGSQLCKVNPLAKRLLDSGNILTNLLYRVFNSGYLFVRSCKTATLFLLQPLKSSVWWKPSGEAQTSDLTFQKQFAGSAHNTEL